MSTREHLHQAIDMLDEDDAVTILRFITRFVIPDDVATKDDIEAIIKGRSNYQNNDFLTLDEYDKKRKAAQ